MVALSRTRKKCQIIVLFSSDTAIKGYKSISSSHNQITSVLLFTLDAAVKQGVAAIFSKAAFIALCTFYIYQINFMMKDIKYLVSKRLFYYDVFLNLISLSCNSTKIDHAIIIIIMKYD